jgi:hypothetical protein
VFSQGYLAIFAHWTNAHGAYAVEVQLGNLDGDVLWREEMKAPFETHDPLQIWQLALHQLHIAIPEPGKYEVACLQAARKWRAIHCLHTG